MSGILVVIAIGALVITQAPHHSLDVKPSFGEVNPGEMINTTIYVTKSGGIPALWEFRDNVSIAASDTASGITISFIPMAGAPSPVFKSLAQIHVAPNATNSSHVITIIGLDENQHIQTARYNVQVGRDEGQKSYQLPTPVGTITPQKIFDVNDYYYPSGWMGDINDIYFDATSKQVTARSGSSSIEIKYFAKSKETHWSGIYWQYPENNWGDKPGSYDLSGFSTLSFWARGEHGGESAEFKIGGLNFGAFPDSLQPALSTKNISLSSDWKEYTIDLRGQDLRRIGGGFAWVTYQDKNPLGCTIYLDDIFLNK